jgi:hypothetical protein
MKHNSFFLIVLAVCFVLAGCNSNYNMTNDVDNPEELKKEEMKLDPYEKCEVCPSCNSDYRYFYICSHGGILMMCNECYAAYDVACEAGLRDKKDEHQIDMYECFNKSSRLATKDDLEKAGLIDFVNKLGLLDEEDETDK